LLSANDVATISQALRRVAREEQDAWDDDDEVRLKGEAMESQLGKGDSARGNCLVEWCVRISVAAIWCGDWRAGGQLRSAIGAIEDGICGGVHRWDDDATKLSAAPLVGQQRLYLQSHHIDFADRVSIVFSFPVRQREC
jgi:hypothetical protein